MAASKPKWTRAGIAAGSYKPGDDKPNGYACGVLGVFKSHLGWEPIHLPSGLTFGIGHRHLKLREAKAIVESVLAIDGAEEAMAWATDKSRCQCWDSPHAETFDRIRRIAKGY